MAGPRSTISGTALLLLVGALSACEAGGLIDVPPVADRPLDAGGDRFPPGAEPCEDDVDCDDGVACTLDRCVNGLCQFRPEPARCSDGVFCNGGEICDLRDGCQAVAPRSCDDRDPCTLDRCNEEARTCENLPRDSDGDGEVDWHCAGGTDCDDFDALRGARQRERCQDGIDNDCDGDIDEAVCGSISHDTCDDALDVSGGGNFVVGMRGAVDDYTLGCDDPGLNPRDVALRLSLDAPRDLRVDAQGSRDDSGPASIAVTVRDRCGDAASELDCGRGPGDQLRVRALPAGEHFILLSSPRATEARVRVELSEPTRAPENAVCSAATDVSEGGRWEADLVDVANDAELRCGFSDAGEVFYGFELEARRDVVISALNLSNTGDMAISVRRACGDAESEVRCMRGHPAVGRLRDLEPGSYVVAVEGPSYTEVDFAFDIAFEAATEPLPGDACQSPEPLESGMESTGSLSDKEDRVQTSCGFHVPDAVYRLALDEPSDVRFGLEGEAGVMSLSLQRSCVSQENAAEQPSLEDVERVCLRGQPVRARVRGLQAGEHTVVVESSAAADFALRADVSPAQEAQPIDGNDTCAAAAQVPETGGYFSGDTSLMLDQYESGCGGTEAGGDAAYVLELGEARRVRVTVTPQSEGFDTVLSRFFDRGDGPESCESSRAGDCNDDAAGVPGSVLDEHLGAARHYYVVDGRSAGDVGAYTIDFLISEP